MYDSVFWSLSYTWLSLICFNSFSPVVYSSSLSSGISCNDLSLVGHLSACCTGKKQLLPVNLESTGSAFKDT